ncbi:N-acetyltransferase [Hahella aquimaris]|uniref:N-acetyltransferase n=1 Tax=Hahella sp. HNIBRBA332 TaxID=3015983 RepID=UPI00273CB040|nr:N-acetyltransferase [Hahella sp. HNIBRBA332]WLQ13284.1 N-acetyltransferase [Hahella sp. HNIBRBA332]
MLEVREVEFESPIAEALLRMFKKEWPDLTSFERKKNEVVIPKPLGAFEKESLVGGVSFCGYIGLNGEGTAIWVNAVYTYPSKRKLGVASCLIKEAVSRTPKLYALTHIPKLYTKLGWRIVGNTSEGIQLQSW